MNKFFVWTVAIILAIPYSIELSQAVDLPQDEASCTKIGGRWWGQRSKMVQPPTITWRCSIPTSDADKPCSSARECQSNDCQAPHGVSAGHPTTGRCVGWIGQSPKDPDCFQTVKDGIAGPRYCV